MKKQSLWMVVSLLVLVELSTSSVDADPFVNLNMYGRRHGSGDPYTQEVVAAPGETIDLLIAASMAGGVTNSNGYTVTSLALGTDGCNSLAIDFFEPASSPTQISFDTPMTFSGDWGTGSNVATGSVVSR